MTEITSAALYELCDATRTRLDVTGASVAVIHRGQLSVAASGIANATLSAPMHPETLMQIGSTTKIFTAVLLMQLVDRGLVDLDAPVSAVLPGIRLATDNAAEQITPRQLLSMSSGLSSGPYADPGRDDDCVRRYVDGLGDLPMLFAPGSAYGYSNSSTVVSGLIIEELTGLTWDDALAENLLRPAGMNDSTSRAERLPYHRVAVGHDPDTDGSVIDQEWIFSRAMGPAGSTLATSAADLAKFGEMFLSGGVSEDGTRVLSEDTVRMMHSSQLAVPPRWFANDWCLGFYRKAWDGLEVFGHGGTTTQSSSTLNWIPELDLSVAVLANNPSRGYPLAQAVLDEVVGEWLGAGKPKRPIADLTLAVDPSPYLGEYWCYGAVYNVSTDDRGLVLTMTVGSGMGSDSENESEQIESVLQPIGDHRFLAVDDQITGFRGLDLAFSEFESGQAQLFYNAGFVAARSA